MKTTKLISRAIMAACLCLGMTACGDDDGTNPGGGSNGEGGSVGSELKFTGLTVQPNDDVNYTYYRSISYNADGTPRDIGWVRDDRTTIETFYFDYADNAEGGSTITVRYESNVYLDDDTRYTCEVNSEGHITNLTRYLVFGFINWEYTYDKNGRMTKSVEKEYPTLDAVEAEKITEYDISWKNGNITQVEIWVNGEKTYINKYKYTSYPASRGIVYSLRDVDLLYGPFGDEEIRIFANTGEFFGKSPKNLISSVSSYTVAYNWTTSWDLEYTFHEAPHPAEGFVDQIKTAYQVLTIHWQEPEEQL